MLILSRRPNENIVIGGQIVVKIIRIDRDTVSVGIDAPPAVSVHRQEVFEAIQRKNTLLQKPHLTALHLPDKAVAEHPLVPV